MTRPLFERFPILLGRIPFLEIVDAPTPVRNCRELGKSLGCENFFIKRDDISAREYGGNKPRKLEFLLAQAKSEGCGAVVTIGGIGTNHGLATAVYARKFGMRCHLVLFDQPVTENVKKNLLLFHRYQATCHYAGGYAKTAWLVARQMITSHFHRTGACLIPGGGSNALGCLGFIDAAFELSRQIEAGELPCPEFIFCAVGSCGTYAGLLAGIKLARIPTKLIGVRVVDKIVVNTHNVLKHANRALDLLRTKGAEIGDVKVMASDIHILDDFFGGEYGKVTPEGLDAVRLAAEHGVKIETTYTGKTFAGMRDFLGRRKDDSGAALFWNTYNSVDLSEQLSQVSPLDLDPVLRRFFTESK
jgi:D-cysteine desulfhydrase